MPNLSEFPTCCGVDLFVGFENIAPWGAAKEERKAIIKERCEPIIKQVVSGRKFLNDDCDELPEAARYAYPGLYLITLTKQQREEDGLDKLVRKYGFEPIMENIKNPKTGNDITLYGLRFEMTNEIVNWYEDTYGGESEEDWDD